MIFRISFQSCFFSWEGGNFSTADYQPYLNLIRDLRSLGVKLKLIQSYTLSRTPAEFDAIPWSVEEMDLLHEFLVKHLDVPVKTICQAGVKDT